MAEILSEVQTGMYIMEAGYSAEEEAIVLGLAVQLPIWLMQ